MNREECVTLNWIRALGRNEPLSDSEHNFISRFKVIESQSSHRLVYEEQIFSSVKITPVSNLSVDTFNKLHMIATKPVRRKG